MKKLVLFFVVLACLLYTKTVSADEYDAQLQANLNTLNLENVDVQAHNTDTSFKKWVEKIISGNLSLSPNDIAQEALDLAFGEIKNQLALVKKILLILILSAVLKNFNASFQGKSVGELGFYVCYMVLILLIISTFYSQIAMVRDTFNNMTNSFLAMAPAFMTLAATSGSAAQWAVLGPSVMAGAALLSTVLTNVILPAITLTASLEMVSNVTEKPMLGKFTALIKGGIGLSLKGIAFLFMAIFSVQKIGSAPLNSLVGKTAKAAVGAIPVVGDVMGGAVETAAALTGTLRSGLMAGSAIFLVLICALPLIKLGVITIIYKLCAAAAEPACEGRLVKCLSAAGDFSAMLFSALFLADVMFTFSALLLLSIF